MDASERRPHQPLPQTASPFQAATTGTLVFQSDVAGRPKIFTVDVATGQVRQITQGTEWRDESPRWSPDGQSIAFTSNRAHYGATPEAGTPDLDVYVMRADGSQVRRITTDPGNDHDPSWLPDGQSLVFSSDRASRGDLYRVRLSDGHTTRLTTNFVGRAIMPAVSPDGAKVAFAAQTLRVGAFWNFQVHLLDLASGRTEPVPASGGACWPAWSPDGRVLYSVQLDSEPSAIQRRDLSNGAVQVAHAERDVVELLPAGVTRRAMAGAVSQPRAPRRGELGPGARLDRRLEPSHSAHDRPRQRPPAVLATTIAGAVPLERDRVRANADALVLRLVFALRRRAVVGLAQPDAPFRR